MTLQFRHGDFVDGQPLGPWCDQAETRCTVLREDFFYKTMIMRWDGELLEYFDRRSVSRSISPMHLNVFAEDMAILATAGEKLRWLL